MVTDVQALSSMRCNVRTCPSVRYCQGRLLNCTYYRVGIVLFNTITVLVIVLYSTCCCLLCKALDSWTSFLQNLLVSEHHQLGFAKTLADLRNERLPTPHHAACLGNPNLLQTPSHHVHNQPGNPKQPSNFLLLSFSESVPGNTPNSDP